jgi:alanine racemase
MLEGFFKDSDLQRFSAFRLSTVIHCADQIERLAASRLDQPLQVFLKLNTGMNRLGFSLDAAEAAYQALIKLDQVASVTIMTHFADADNARGSQWQLVRLNSAWPGAMASTTSFANSAALLAGPAVRESLGDIARPGIMLYGASPWGCSDPGKTAMALGLAPVMSLRSAVIAIQHLQPGDRVGYGGTFTADQPMRIGIVACGYADGYPRHGSDVAPILVDGVRTRVVGRVSMDMLCCDLNPVPEAEVGSPVTLWGAGLPADEVAEAAGTIAYELFCGVTPRVPRIWLD